VHDTPQPPIGMSCGVSYGVSCGMSCGVSCGMAIEQRPRTPAGSASVSVGRMRNMAPAQPDYVWNEDLARRIAAAGEPTPDDAMAVPAGVELITQQDHDDFITEAIMGFATD